MKEINNIYKDIKIENYIIMPNYVHTIIELAREKEYYEIIKYMQNKPIRWVEKESEGKNGRKRRIKRSQRKAR